MNIFTKSKYGFLLLFLLGISVYGVAQPLNDDCSGAQPVTTGTYTFNTSTATASPQATCNANPADFAKDIWYEYTPNCSADITFALCGSSFNTYMDIYTGSCASLTCLTSNDDLCAIQSQITLTSPTPGVTYYIRIGGVAGASGAGQMVVSSSDNTPPVISGCPVNQTVPNDPGVCGAAVTWTPPTGFDNCDFQGLTTTHAPGTVFSVGSTTVIYTASDAAGNTATCSFVITVNDTEAPVVSGCPGNIIQNNDLNDCGAIVTWTEPTATDNCGITITNQSHNPGDFFPVGTSTVTYTWEDAAGNISTCSFDVTINDTQSPTALCQNATLNLGPAGFVVVGIPDVDNGSSDNCAFTITLDTDTLTCADIAASPINVTLTVTDASGNTATCIAQVTVQDVTPPTAVCQDITVYLDGTGNASIVASDIDGGSFDNCATISLSASQTAFTCADIGANTVTLTVDDGNGNTATCDATVTVADTIAPVVSGCPADIIAPSGASCSVPVNWTEPTAADNCDGAMTYTTRSHAPGDIFPTGTTVVTYTFVDASGNVASCSFNVIVQDNVPPVAACQPGPVVVVLDATGNATVDPATIDNGSSDNCGSVSLSVSPSTVSCADVGIVNVILTVTDSSGNTATCATTIDVQDNSNPTFTGCPTDITQNNDAGLCGASVTWTPPTANDACGATVTASHNPGDFFGIGTTTVTYIADDGNGNTAVCAFDVTVIDNEFPVVSNCPLDITQDNDPGLCGASVTWTAPTFTDNCSVIVTPSHNPGDFFPVGTTTVIYSAVDPSGNTTTCTFDVTVVDVEAPSMVCPADITVSTVVGDCSQLVSWTNPTVTDNCAGPITFTSSHPNPGLYPVGTTTVTLTAEDAAGNTTVCTFDITVEDNENPQITGCPSNMIVPALPGQCAGIVTWTPPTASDNCPGVTLTTTLNPPAVLPVGVTTVTYTATDASGNVTTCQFTITVVDVEPPVVTCPADITVNNDNGMCGAVVNFTPTATDNCPGTVITSSPASGSMFPLGTTTVLVTATDASGNMATCTFDVTVNDTEDPSITCPADISVNNDPGLCEAVVTFTAPTFTDNCPGATISQTSGLPSGSAFPVGTTTNVFTVTDASGNTSTCAFDVEVIDNENPVITCPADITVSNDFGVCEASVTVPQPTVSDNCPPVTNIFINEDFNACSSGPPAGWSTVILSGSDDWTFDTGVIPGGGSGNDFTTCAAIFDDDGAGSSGDNTVILYSPIVDITGYNLVNLSFDYIMNETGGLDNMTVEVWDGSSWVQVLLINSDVNSSFSQSMLPYANPNFQVRFTYDDNDGWGWGAGIDNFLLFGQNPLSIVNDYNNTDDASDTYPVGTTTVIWTVTDPNGNTSTCSMDVTVNDTEAPVIANCPTSFTTCGSLTGGWIEPTASDNCGVTSFTSNFGPNDTLPAGTTTIVYIAFDAAGNSDTCSFDVTIGTPVIADAGADASLCFGSVTTLGGAPTATGGTAPYTYAWAPATGLSSTTSANPTASPSSTTTYTVTVTDISGCTDTDEVTVTVHPLPTVDAGPDQQVCLGSSVQIGGNPTAALGTPPYTYTWFPATGLNDPALANPVASPTTTTTYTVSVQDINGCTRFDEVTVTVNPLPTADAGADITICEGTSTVIGGAPTASGTVGPYSYVWTPAAGLSATNIANPTANPTATTTYTVMVLDANGCSTTDEVIVTVNPAPTADAGADMTICDGDVVMIGGAPTASGTLPPYTYSWMPVTGLDDPTLANPMASPSVSTMYVVTITDANGCTDMDTMMVTVNPLPVVSVTPAGPYCSGDAPVTLTATPSGGTWSGTGVSVGGVFDPAVAGVGTHTIVYTYTDANTCTNSDTIDITVNPGPDATITTSGTFCDNGAVVTLTAVTPGGTWSGPGVDPVGTFDPSLAGVGTHIISYSVTSGGCTSMDTASLTVIASPDATIAAVGALCDNSAPITLTAATAGGTWSGTGVDPVTGVFDPAVSGAGTFTITYSVTNVGGCTSSDTEIVTVNPSPAPTITAAGPFCATGGAVTLSASISGGFWSGTGIINPFSGLFDPSVAGVGTHTITYTVSNSFGCTGTATTTINVVAAPNTTINPVGTLCANSAPVTLTAVTPGGSFSGPGVVGNTFNPALTGPGTFVISYTVTGTGGCTAVGTTTIIVTSDLNVQGFVTDINCSGSTNGGINLVVSGGVAPYTFAWSNNATTQNLANVAAGTYSVTVTSTNGCTETATFTVAQPANPITATAIVTPTLTPAYSNGEIDFDVTGGTPGYDFMWSNGATTEDITNLKQGTYTVTVTDAAGCIATFTYTVNAEFGIGIDVKTLTKHINLYPNPTSSILNIEIEIGMTKDVDILVVDMLGRQITEIHDEIVGKYNTQIDMSNYASGQYMIIFNIDGNVVNKKFTVTK